MALPDPQRAVVGLDAGGAVRPAPAKVMGVLSEDDVGRQVAVMFENGDPERPVVLGPLAAAAPQKAPADARQRGPREERELEIDLERLLLTASGEIVLRCGKSSITLTRAGKVIIRGTYVSSTSSGINRVNGGSVRFN
jgi:hypothetical protein